MPCSLQGALLPSFGSTFCSPTGGTPYHTPAPGCASSSASESAVFELEAALQREAAAQEEVARLVGQLDAAERARANLAEEQGQLGAELEAARLARQAASAKHDDALAEMDAVKEQLAARGRECYELAAALGAKEAQAVALQGRLDGAAIEAAMVASFPCFFSQA